MNDQAMNERLSALADGELGAAELPSVLAHAATEEGQWRWRIYHDIGDVLRHSEPPAAHDAQLLARLSARLADEPRQQRALDSGAVTTLAQPAVHAANAPLWRWRAVAGVASLVALAALAWDVYVGAAPPGAQLAQAPAPVLAASAEQPSAQQAAVMLRDPRLDEWLAENRKNAGVSVLQAPAGFLRNANFQTAVQP